MFIAIYKLLNCSVKALLLSRKSVLKLRKSELLRLRSVN